MGANDGTKGSGFNAPQRLPFTQKGGNTSLQLKKVPQGANNITHLNNHFSKFGKIVNIQVSFWKQTTFYRSHRTVIYPTCLLYSLYKIINIIYYIIVTFMRFKFSSYSCKL